MTSTTAGILDEIKFLFSWNPPSLVVKAKPSKKPPTTTRPPSFYDKHFSPDLVVKKVVRYPSLAQDLAENVNRVLEAALKTLPPLEEGFITAKQRRHDLRNLNKKVTNEAAVGEFYLQTTAKYCSLVASMLALHPSYPEWQSLLSWTQSAFSSGYAIVDGQLCFLPEGDDQDKIERAAIVETIDSKFRAIVVKLGESMSSLATWEMKSVPTGSPEVMAAVRNLGEFSWTFCANDCGSKQKHVNTTLRAKQTVIGPDAQAPPWSFPVEDHGEGIDILPLRRPVTQRVIQSAAASGSSTLPPPSPRASRSSEHRSPMKGTGKKRKRDDDQDTTTQSGSGLMLPPSPPPPPPPPLPPPSASRSEAPTDKGKERSRDDEVFQDRDDMTAQNLVQQAWAQAVNVDGTVIVLHSGNQELVCLRHRSSQTLFVSDIIVPSTCSDPGYGQLHVGIYIAAIQDMMDRQLQQQLSESKSPGDGDNDDNGGNGDNGNNGDDFQDHIRGSGRGHKRGRGHRRGRRTGRPGGRFQASGGRKGDDELVAIEKAIDVASNRDVVLLYLQYGVYDSPIPASFLRSAHSIMAHTKSPTPLFSLRALHSYGPEECLTIVLTSEIGRGATGVAHRGTLKPEICDGAMPLDVVVKLAFNSEQRDALRNEYEVYRHLKSKRVHRGIATVLGIFDDSEGCACALVLLYAGVPLSSQSHGNLSISDSKSALSTLKCIHRAGILHGDIRRANILTGDLGVTIIDFGHSKQCDKQETKDKELAQLSYWLSSSSEDREW